MARSTRTRSCIVAGALCAALWGGTAAADSVAIAQSTCLILDKTFAAIDMLDRKCEVRPAEKSVSGYIDFDQQQAVDLCVATSKLLKDNRVRFDRGWTLKIFNPRQTGTPLAICAL